MFEPNCDVFAAGSYPDKNPKPKCQWILKHPNVLLHWPQLPKRSAREIPLEQTLKALKNIEGKSGRKEFPIGSASGWNAMWQLLKKKRLSDREYFKTQLIGPVTLFGKVESASPKRKRGPQKSNEAKLLGYLDHWIAHAAWQIEAIKDKGFKPILFLDEHMLPNYMGPSSQARARRILKLLHSVVARLKRRGAVVGIHCCNRISPETLIRLEVDIIHFNAFHFPTQTSVARSALQSFIRNGGIVAWGVIPTTETITSMTETKIEKLLMELLMGMESRALPLRQVLAQSMIAPTCGTGALTPEQSEKVMNLAMKLSNNLQTRYRLKV